VIRERWKRWLMVIFGALSVAAGVLAFGGESLVMIPFGVMAVAMGVMKPSAPGSTDGVRAQGGSTVFDFSPARERVAALACACFALAGLGFLLFPAGFADDEPAWYIRLLGGTCVVLFGGFGLLRARRGLKSAGGVELSPESITMRHGTGHTVVPWDAVGEVNLIEIRGNRMAGLVLAHDTGVVLPAVSHLFRRVNRSMGADVSIPLNTLRCDPDAFYDLLVHMHAHPQDRPQLATGGPDLLRRFA
jgi:hypothetical protein